MILAARITIPIAVLFLATGTLRLAQATERYSVR